jgi:transformation/transcription domain-associated protein
MKIVAAVFNIFHLLPPAAEGFKERLINTCLELEGELRRTCYSPFRVPLYKYLNRYPNEVWLFFLGLIEDQKYGRFLAQVLKHRTSGALRNVVVNNVQALIMNCGDMGAENKENRYTAYVTSLEQKPGWRKRNI